VPTTTPENQDVDERKAAILRSVVEEYIETAQPVGSGHVARTSGLAVSPATVRNEMTALESEGYLRQPHTSAGRVPTDKGYRFFVDGIAEPGTLGVGQRQQVRSFFASAHGALEEMLQDTSRLLSSLTDNAAVVVGRAHEEAGIRSVQLVGLGSGTALVVAVLANGVVEKATLETSAIDKRLLGLQMNFFKPVYDLPKGITASTICHLYRRVSEARQLEGHGLKRQLDSTSVTSTR
jgi:heat shock gene repressor HrcA